MNNADILQPIPVMRDEQHEVAPTGDDSGHAPSDLHAQIDAARAGDAS
jgi:hypothetical protein